MNIVFWADLEQTNFEYEDLVEQARAAAQTGNRGRIAMLEEQISAVLRRRDHLIRQIGMVLGRR